MIKRILFLLYLLIYLSSVILLAQNEDRRHWQYIDDYANDDTPTELSKLGSVSWTDGCYIGDNKAVVYASGDLFLFDYNAYAAEWSPLVISAYYKMNNQGEREVVTNESIPTNLVGMSLAYVGNNKILLGPGRLGGSTNFKKTWVFDLTDNSWTLMIDETLATDVTIPLLYDYGICHLVEDKVLIFGGYTRTPSSAQTNDTYIYDLSNNSWENITASMTTSPSVRSAHSLTSLGEGSAIMFGGMTGSVSNNETWVMDYIDGIPKWTQLTIPSPGARYYNLLQKLSSDIAILYGGTTDYGEGVEHYNDVWRFNYDRDNTTGTWVDISFSEYPTRDAHNSSNIDDYLYYPANSEDSLANDNYRHVDGELVNNGGGGYGVDAGNSSGTNNTTQRDHWGLYHGKRRAMISAFLGNDRILLHGGAVYTYDGVSSYVGNVSLGKSYVFDLGIPDVFIDTVISNSSIEGVDVVISVGELNDDRGIPIEEAELTVTLKYKRTNAADDAYVLVPVTVPYSDSSMVSVIVELPDLPPNTEIEIICAIDADGFGSNNSDSYVFTTPGGNKTLHLINSFDDGVSGLNDYTILNSATVDFTADFSISQWVRIEEAASRYIFRRNLTSSPISLVITDNQIEFSTTGGSVYTSVTPSKLNMLGTWHHIVITYNHTAQEQSIYLDGDLLVQTSNDGFIQDSNSENLVFDVQQSVSLDEFQFWGVALTIDQIAQIMYQPVVWEFPNEVHGAVDLNIIEGLIWDDLQIYYKGDYIDMADPFSARAKGCMCEITGSTGMSMINTIYTTKIEQEFDVQSHMPYINWTRLAAVDLQVEDFNNENNWDANMYPQSPNVDSYQALVVNVNIHAYYPTLTMSDFDDLHTLVLREGTHLSVQKECPLYVTNAIIHDGGSKILVENDGKLLFGEKDSAIIINP